MDPKASVSALVFHHPDCRYFSVGERSEAYGRNCFPDSCCSMAIHENATKKELPSGTWEPLQGLNSSLVRVASYPVPSNGLTRIWAIMDALAPTENFYLFEEAAGLERSLGILSLTRALGNPRVLMSLTSFSTS